MANYHITVHGADRDAMADIVRVHGVRVYGQTLKAEARTVSRSTAWATTPRSSG